MSMGLGMAMPRRLLRSGGGGSLEFPVAPTFAIYSADNTLSDGSVVANRYASTAPNKNAMTLTTGYIKQASATATVTNFFANGPTGTLTAQRLEFAADTSQYSLYTGAPPAGSYRLTFKAKLNSGGPTKNIRHGNTTAGYATATVNDTTWTAVTQDFTTTGSNYTPYQILPAIGNAPVDLLIDELQWYATGDLPIPAFTAETNDWHFKIRNKGYAGAIARSGNLLDNATGGAAGNVIAPTFPAATTLTEWTVIIAFKYETLGSGQMIVSEIDAILGSTANNLQVSTGTGAGVVGQISFQPLGPGSSRIEPLGEGWHTYAIRVKNLARSCHFNGVELNSATTAYTGFQARILNLGGQTAASPSRGKFGVWAFWDSYLSDDDLAAAHRKIESDIVAMGEARGAVPYFWLAEGDSITATTTAPDGPSYAFLVSAAGYFAGKPPLYMRCRAVSGSGIATLETRKAQNLVVIGQMIATGAQPIVSIMIGTNDTSEIASLGHMAYWAKLLALYTDYRNAGALVVACTLLPDGTGSATWDTERGLLNAYMRTQTSAYDALADVAADANIGQDASVLDPTYYNVDQRHLTAAGHVVAAGIVKTAMQALGV